jgi:hypothetical protein
VRRTIACDSVRRGSLTGGGGGGARSSSSYVRVGIGFGRDAEV